jgi:hypothetical protein
VPSNDVHVAGFSIVGLDGRRYFLGQKNAVHVQLADPTNPYWGMSMVEAGSRPIDTDRRAANWQAKALENGLIPPGAFVINDEQGMTEDEFTAAETQLKAQYQGSDNARRPLILSNTKWIQLSINPSDMDWLGGRAAGKKEIALLFGVPLALVGEQDTFTNVHEARAIHWEDGVLPLAGIISDAMTLQLAQPEYGDEVVIAPDTRRVPALIRGRLEQINGVQKLWAMGAPFNSAAEYMGLDYEIPGGDVGYVPTNLLPSTTEGAVDSVDMIAVDQPPDESAFKPAIKNLPRKSKRQHRTSVKDFRRWLNTDVEDAEIVDLDTQES